MAAFDTRTTRQSRKKFGQSARSCDTPRLKLLLGRPRRPYGVGREQQRPHLRSHRRGLGCLSGAHVAPQAGRTQRSAPDRTIHHRHPAAFRPRRDGTALRRRPRPRRGGRRVGRGRRPGGQRTGSPGTDEPANVDVRDRRRRPPRSARRTTPVRPGGPGGHAGPGQGAGPPPAHVTACSSWPSPPARWPPRSAAWTTCGRRPRRDCCSPLHRPPAAAERHRFEFTMDRGGPPRPPAGCASARPRHGRRVPARTAGRWSSRRITRSGSTSSNRRRTTAGSRRRCRCRRMSRRRWRRARMVTAMSTGRSRTRGTPPCGRRRPPRPTAPRRPAAPRSSTSTPRPPTPPSDPLARPRAANE